LHVLSPRPPCIVAELPVLVAPNLKPKGCMLRSKDGNKPG
jgi:hypothetical protein